MLFCESILQENEFLVNYTVSFKLDVLQFTDKDGVQAAICKFKHLIFSLG